MNKLDQLEKIAQENRLRFNDTLRQIKVRTQFPAVTQDVFALLNIRRKGPPLIAAGAVASAIWAFNKIKGAKGFRTVRLSKNSNHKTGEK
jgi:hypothetical protein